MNKNLPYKTVFQCRAKVIVPEGYDQYMAKASLNALKEIMPEENRISENPDLLFIAADLFVADLGNLNGDVILAEDATKISPNLIMKPINIEHNRNHTIGVILNHAFREYGSNDNAVINEESIASIEDPFNVSISGAIWRLIASSFQGKDGKTLVDMLIEASDENSENFGLASLSWEVGFTDFHIMVGSKFAKEATFVTDEEEIKKLGKFIKGNGGKGETDEGEPVFRVLKGEIIPVGAGIVTNPAADVKGITVKESEDAVIIEDEAEREEKKEKKTSKYNLDNGETHFVADEDINAEEKNIVKISQSNETDVKKDTRINKHMKITNLDELNEVLAGNLKEDAHSSIAFNIVKFVEQGIREGNEKFEKESEARKTAEENLQGLEASKTELETKLKELKESLNEIKAAQEEEAKAQAFQERMTALDNDYELSEDDRARITPQINDLDDEGYSAWLETFAVLCVDKNKEVIAKQRDKIEQEVRAKIEEEQKKDSKEKDDDEIVKEAIASAKETGKGDLPDGATESLTEKFVGALTGDAVEISN